MFGDNLIIEGLVTLAVAFALSVLTFLVGFFLDPIQRGLFMRNILKMNTYALCVVSRDIKDIQIRLIRPEGGVIKVGKCLWVVDGERIYRQDKPDKGFAPAQEHFKSYTGLPAIFVDETDIKPLDLYRNDQRSDPEAIGALLNAWILNQYAKGLAKMNQMQLFGIITMVLCIAIAFGTYMTYTAANACAANTDHIRSMMMTELATNGQQLTPENYPVGEAFIPSGAKK